MWAPSWAILNYSLDSYFFSFLECLGANLGAAEANPQTAAGLRALPKFNIGTAASLRQGGSQAGEESSAGPFLFTKGKEFHRSSEASSVRPSHVYILDSVRSYTILPDASAVRELREFRRWLPILQLAWPAGRSLT
jgi:hypothetical protein